MLVGDLQRGFEVLKKSGCDYAFSVTRYASPVQRAIRVTKANRIEMLDPAHFKTRSQDLEEVFHDAGQFYWGMAEAWLEERLIFTSNAAPIILPRHRVQDIDTPDDWVRAEMMFSAIKQQKNFGEY